MALVQASSAASVLASARLRISLRCGGDRVSHAKKVRSQLCSCVGTLVFRVFTYSRVFAPSEKRDRTILLTQAVEHALHNLTAEIPKQASLYVDITGLQTDRAHLNMVEKDRAVLYGASSISS